jgi:hypothetical protein
MLIRCPPNSRRGLSSAIAQGVPDNDCSKTDEATTVMLGGNAVGYLEVGSARPPVGHRGMSHK